MGSSASPSYTPTNPQTIPSLPSYRRRNPRGAEAVQDNPVVDGCKAVGVRYRNILLRTKAQNENDSIRRRNSLGHGTGRVNGRTLHLPPGSRYWQGFEPRPPRPGARTRGGCLGGGDASSECVHVTCWLRLNIHE